MNPSPSDTAPPAMSAADLADRVRELETQLDAERSAASDRFRCAVEAAPNGIVMADGEGRIVFANQRARDLFGYSAEEMESLAVEQLMPERYRLGHTSLRRGYHADPEPRPMGIGRDLFACRKDGSEFPVEIGLTPMEIGGERLILGMIADITERKRAVSALGEKAHILASVHEAVFTVNASGIITSWNPGATAIFGWNEDEILGNPAALLCPPDEPDRFAARVVPELRAHGHFESTLRCRHRSGAPITLAIRASTNSAAGEDGGAGAIVCAHDITRQKQLEDEIVQISEKEQRRIGQDLHDDLCQQLAGIGCLAKVLQQELDSAGNADHATALERVVEMISQANTRAREISRGLAPAVIQREGLSSALSELASRTRRVFGVPCTFTCPDPVFVENEKRAVQLYRIAQEAIANAVKHSDASRIDIHLDLLPGQIRLRVADDGKGLPPQSAGPGASGLGLLTMAHRAEILDGDLDIRSSPGRGTTIVCTAPHQNE